MIKFSLVQGGGSGNSMGKGEEGNEKVLSYGDVVMRRSDLDILAGPHFLNDRIIEFYFTYLASKKYSSQEDIAFVSPSVSFWIAKCNDATFLTDCLAPLKLRDKNLVIFTVNDNVDVNEAGGGSHWSLLVYYRKMNMFVHHDSFHGINSLHAEMLSKSVAGLLADYQFAASASFVDCPTPRQRNAHDCGLYVLAIAERICDWYQDASEGKGDDWFSAVSDKVVDSMGVAILRTVIKNLILDLKEGNGRTSSSST